MSANLFNRAAKAWKYFDKYLELFNAFALHTPEAVIRSIKNNDFAEESMTPAALVGLEYCFRTNLVD